MTRKDTPRLTAVAFFLRINTSDFLYSETTGWMPPIKRVGSAVELTGSGLLSKVSAARRELSPATSSADGRGRSPRPGREDVSHGMRETARANVGSCDSTTAVCGAES
jgi:hypothetical protein